MLYTYTAYMPVGRAALQHCVYLLSWSTLCLAWSGVHACSLHADWLPYNALDSHSLLCALRGRRLPYVQLECLLAVVFSSTVWTGIVCSVA